MRLPIGTRKRQKNNLLRRSPGLTLIELVLVTALLLAIVSFSVPLFKKTFSGLSARDASLRISKLINYAQEAAVLENKNFKIVFDFQKGKYQLLEMDVSLKPPAYKRRQGRFGKLFAPPKEITLSGQKKEAIFYPDGHCDDISVNVLVKGMGYTVTAKRFGNIVEVREAEIER